MYTVFIDYRTLKRVNVFKGSLSLWPVVGFVQTAPHLVQLPSTSNSTFPIFIFFHFSSSNSSDVLTTIFGLNSRVGAKLSWWFLSAILVWLRDLYNSRRPCLNRSDSSADSKSFTFPASQSTDLVAISNNGDFICKFSPLTSLMILRILISSPRNADNCGMRDG